MGTFTEFTFDELPIDEQEFDDYKSKYLDIRDKVKNNKETVSILNDVDFEIELIRRDEINVAYILGLLAKLQESKPKDAEKQRKAITDMMASETQLRSKKELIEKFMIENLPLLTDVDNIQEFFDSYWTTEKVKAIENLSKEENLDAEKLNDVIGKYLFTEKQPLRDEVIGLMNERPSLKERATASERILNKIISFVDTFIDGMG
jgi:type I restriction enzyme R subunit